MDFKNAAITGSQIYYEYLRKNNESIKEYEVADIKIEKIFCYLTLKENLRSLDNLQIKINATVFNDSNIKIIKYNYDKHILKISPNKLAKEHLENSNIDNIKIIVDLKFLVKNIEEFYRRYGNQLQLPYYINNIDTDDESLLLNKLSQEQIEAVYGALNNSLTYIWGAPGTGKTRFVLAHCVFPYIQANQKVLIVAPTNNAIEQTLYGIMPVLNSHGINLETVFRMGTATNEFSKKYPMCCEDSDIDKKANKLISSIKDINKQIDLFPKYEKSIEFEKHLYKCETILPDLFNKLGTVYNKIRNAKETITANEGKITLAQQQVKELTDSKALIIKKIESYTLSVKKYSNGIFSKIFKSKLHYYKSQLEDTIDYLSTTEQWIDSYKKTIESTTSENLEYSIILDSHKLQENELLNLICKTTEFWDKFSSVTKNINIDNFYESEETLFNYIEKANYNLEKRKEKYTELELEKSTVEELKSRLKKYKEEYDNILSKTSTSRLLNCNVIATTVDTCVRRLTPDNEFKPKHIFLDEAGYCSLIKGATLLSYNCPVTLLGDHMQLPPICKMEDKQFSQENEVVSLYAQSTLFLEDIYNDSSEIAQRYLNNDKPQFEHLKKYDLNSTYRFGDELANVLADYVYSKNFRSALGKGMELYYVHCPYFKTDTKRVSVTEQDNIVKYTQKHSNEEIAVITPYNNQCKALKNKFFKSNIDKDILTVHGSQGREFDTILFSVVDTYDKWFTNTLCKQSKGVNVINTAVSRAKKKLVIFCDVNYWQKQHKQLIKQILDVATELKL